jgi:transcriptional regulator with XRE-family HTH domain
MKSSMKLKENLKILIEQKGISAVQLAKLANVRKQRISDWLAGANPKDFDQVRAIAQALGVSLDTLLFGSIHGQDPVDSRLQAIPHDTEIVFKVTVQRLKDKL